MAGVDESDMQGSSTVSAVSAVSAEETGGVEEGNIQGSSTDSAPTNTASRNNAGGEGKHADSIELKIKAQDGCLMFFSIKSTTPLDAIRNAFCKRQSLDSNSIVFLFDGKRLLKKKTPAELHMQDGDEIDAMFRQTGGGRL